ncbi:MAG: hypothetical protein M1524_03220 [Patescibacteria group bacterium]|nr:hypothetical protein [Patescibacteria group bacterium]
MFSTAPRKDITETGAVVSQEIGALILVKIPGDVNEKALLESFASQKAFYMSGPAKFDIRVKNESTVHLKPEGTIIIKDMFGKKDASYVESRNILPDATRKLLSTWNKKFLIGKYTANLTLFYGESNQVIYSSTDFYAFPVKEGAIILGVLIILFFLRKRLFRAIKALITGR